MTAEWLSRLTSSPARESHFRQSAARAAQDRRRREQLRAGPPRDYTREEIFDRDGWVCQICSRPVDPATRAPDPGTASIDHIIDVACGGSDTRDNARLAHLVCNMDKLAGMTPQQERETREALVRLLEGEE